MITSLLFALLAATTTTTQNGITVALEVRGPDAARAPRAGDDVVVRFTVTDEATHAPLRGGRPGAWMDSLGRASRPKSCAERVKMLAGESLFERAEIDLNTFYVVAMNDDATLSVVDPQFGFGGSKLLALVALPAPAADWALAADDEHLFVSAPEARQIVAVETRHWKIDHRAPLAATPGRLAIQPDQAYVWTTLPGGVAVLRAADLTLAATIATGPGAHEIAFSADSRWALVTNGASGTVSVIDVRTLAKAKDLPAGPSPRSIAWSALAGAAYVASADGTLTVIGGRDLGVVATMKSAPGLSLVRVAPGGRVALAASARTKSLVVVDTAANRVVQTAQLPAVPDQIAFTPQMAYITFADDADVGMLPLGQLGLPGAAVALADFPGGQNPFGAGKHPSPAAKIVPALDGGAVLVANPADRVIYYYEEGMAAPKGNFSNYDREARAALFIDRGLRERAPGVYETTRRIEHGGKYEVAFVLDAPRVVDCYQVAFEADPPSAPRVAVQLAGEPRLAVGKPLALRFRLTATDAMRDGTVLVFAPGVWQTRLPAQPAADGTYVVEFTPPAPGMYSAYLDSPSHGVKYRWFWSASSE